jgi:iron-sulfur cluster assembly 1
MSGSVISSGIRAVKASSRLAALKTKAPITLTPAAIERVKVLMDSNKDAQGLRIGIKQRGCSGMTYTLEYAKEKKKLDEVVNIDGLKIFIDVKAQLSLLGTQMDFQTNELISEFVFHNPNIKSVCGCGESFSTQSKNGNI